MKKIVLIATVVFLAGSIAKAQDCTQIYPNTKGAELVTKSYTAKNNLLSTTTYTVTDTYDYFSGYNTNMDYTVTNWQGRISEQGKVNLTCDNGVFSMKMNQRYLLPEDLLSTLPVSGELIAGSLDYPNTFDAANPFSGTFAMDNAEYTIRSNNSDEYVTIRINNRKYDNNERVATPAGSFDASKITFDFEVYSHKTKETKKYKGIEWYSLRAGIVRSETRDNDNNLLNYTILESVKN